MATPTSQHNKNSCNKYNSVERARLWNDIITSAWSKDNNRISFWDRASCVAVLMSVSLRTLCQIPHTQYECIYSNAKKCVLY